MRIIFCPPVLWKTSKGFDSGDGVGAGSVGGAAAAGVAAAWATFSPVGSGGVAFCLARRPGIRTPGWLGAGSCAKVRAEMETTATSTTTPQLTRRTFMLAILAESVTEPTLRPGESRSGSNLAQSSTAGAASQYRCRRVFGCTSPTYYRILPTPVSGKRPARRPSGSSAATGLWWRLPRGSCWRCRGAFV